MYVIKHYPGLILLLPLKGDKRIIRQYFWGRKNTNINSPNKLPVFKESINSGRYGEGCWLPDSWGSSFAANIAI